MNNSKSQPPKFAVWLMQHLYPGDGSALLGDLLEVFADGRTREWFWKQVLFAFIIRILSLAGRQWPYFAYALAGAAMPAIFGNVVRQIAISTWWWALPWPWSQITIEIVPLVLPTLAALPVLAIALMIRREFHWRRLMTTSVLSLALITFGHYLLDIWSGRPDSATPPQAALLIRGVLEVLWFFCSLFAAASLPVFRRAVSIKDT